MRQAAEVGLGRPSVTAGRGVSPRHPSIGLNARRSRVRAEQHIIRCRHRLPGHSRQQAVDSTPTDCNTSRLGAATHQTRHHVAVATDNAYVPDRSARNAHGVAWRGCRGPRALARSRLTHAADCGASPLARHDAAAPLSRRASGVGDDLISAWRTSSQRPGRSARDVAANRPPAAAVSGWFRAAGAGQPCRSSLPHHATWC